ncbi:MAG: ABC transporter substrate-binding protein [Candidatus Caldarchaeum sp.]|uniref:Amino acid ABC transporter substrate-binding protein n=1 Tax=Caldiarchaeum subterraneum TaxID=311458 RepID=A0A7J3VU96_CALS0
MTKQSAISTTVAAVLMIVFLAAGVAGGYFAGLSSATGQAATKTEYVTVGGTVTQTQIITAATTLTRTVEGQARITEYTIGFAYELTGAQASFGVDMRDAGLLAVAEANSYLEKSGFPVRFKTVVEDTASTPEGTVRAVQSLVENHKASIIVGPISSLGVAAVKGYLDQKEVVLVSCCSTAVTLKLPDDYIFRVIASADVQGKALSRSVLAEGFKKAVVIYRAEAFGESLFREFKKDFESAGGTVASVAYQPDQSDYSAEVAKLSEEVRKSGPSQTAVVAVSFQTDGLLILGEARLDETLSNVRWFGINTLRVPAFLPPQAPEQIAEFMVKVSLTSSYTAPPNNPKYFDFLSNFEKFHKRKPGPQAELGYDAAWVAILSILSAGTDKGQVLRDVIIPTARKYMGASGHIWMDDAGDRALQDYTISRITKQDGQFRWIDIASYDAATNTIKPITRQ